MTMKRCTTCLVEKPLTEFQKRGKDSNKYFSSCKECGKAYQRKYRKAKRQVRGPVPTRRGWRLNLLQAEEQAKKQGHRCLICRKKRPLVQDHCHATMTFRGLICNPCNVGLGMFADSPAVLRRAARYLLEGS